jgi:hypothetical protein
MRFWLVGDDMPSDQLRPREFLGVLGGAAAARPVAVRAQQAGKLRESTAAIGGAADIGGLAAGGQDSQI